MNCVRVFIVGALLAGTLAPSAAEAGWLTRHRGHLTWPSNVSAYPGFYYFDTDAPSYVSPVWYGYGASLPGRASHYPDSQYFNPVWYGYGASLPGRTTRYPGANYFNPVWYGYGASLPSSRGGWR
jgi:hypothetical protein